MRCQRSVAARIADWKPSYAEMDNSDNAEEEEWETEDPTVSVQVFGPRSRPKKKAPSKKQKELQKLFSLKYFFDCEKENERVLARARDIRVYNPARLRRKDNSVESYIERVLSIENEPIHITSIIQKIEEAGWKTTSTYHKYSIVFSALNRNYPFFERVGKARFRLRQRASADKKETVIIPKSSTDTKLIRLRDVILSVAKEFCVEDNIYPAIVWQIMTRIGYHCAYSSVHRAMQDKTRFSRRNRFLYRPVETNDTKNTSKEDSSAEQS